MNGRRRCLLTAMDSFLSSVCWVDHLGNGADYWQHVWQVGLAMGGAHEWSQTLRKHDGMGCIVWRTDE